MRSKNLVLIKTLLKATSLWNIRKYSKDKKKRGRAIASFIGISCLEIMLFVYSFSTCMGLHAAGVIETVPIACALCVSAIAFVFTFLKTNGYLLNFKEYDMLMALPFKVKDIAICKFLYMYIKSFPWYMGFLLPMMIGYGIFSKSSFWVYPLWLILGLFVPIIPMVIAAFVGFLIAKASAGFKKKNVIQIVLTLIFVMICFSFQYIIEAIFKNDQVTAVALKASELTDMISTYYLPAEWFAKAITMVGQGNVLGLLYGAILVVITIALFEIIFILVGKNYRQINSALQSHDVKRNYKIAGLKKRSVLNTIAYKELKRLTGSTTYFVNVALGEIFAVVGGIAVLILGLDKVVGVVTKGAPIPHGIVYPAIPLMVYFFIGMMATTVCSPSLEGKNYWIMQSLPLEKKTIYQGKMLFNLYLTVPFMIFGVLCFSISAHLPALNMILNLILGLVLCAFSTAWGCVCGIRHMRLDWENEVEVIKQGSAVSIYLLPNMLVTMGLIVLVVWLGTIVNPNLITLVLIMVVAILAVLSYLKVLKLTKK
ncbi:putative ABC transporter permease subunit [Butyrivibrio sp. YAB3001]|uniref:putative ABC transporter permease subunit n=1 Tax=Butyrivibrio sp. YAB3001 TaxID=1520812 RepID=UPI0008F62C2A|nr:hypothetical protein [Butyrivibrio sp. YAB3001]SFC48263.1 ABC-2 type transport system permease protein [Butyrivibrio sp. YAB3001]